MGGPRVLIRHRGDLAQTGLHTAVETVCRVLINSSSNSTKARRYEGRNSLETLQLLNCCYCSGQWLHSFFRVRNPSPPGSPLYVMAIFALAGSARKSMRVRPVMLPEGCRPTLVSLPGEWCRT